MASVALRNVTKRYGDTQALSAVDIEMYDRELTVVVGPSGCGKSTLLRIVAGLEDVDQGDVLIDGERVNHLLPVRRNIAMVFQSYALYPHMTAFDNMAFPLRMAKLKPAAIEGKVREVSRLLKIEGLLQRKPRALSGGQQQRVAMGRAMVRDPAVYLFDEPLSNLDAQLRVEMRDEIARLQREFSATMIYVTHDQVEAMTLAARIVVLNEGRVEQVGSPLELYHEPENRFVAGFIGAPQMNFLGAEIMHIEGRSIHVKLADGTALVLARDPGALQIGDPVTLGIRPEHVVIGTNEAQTKPVLTASVERVQRLGAQSHVSVSTDAGPFTISLAGEVSLREGESLILVCPPDRCHLFDGEGRAL